MLTQFNFQVRNRKDRTDSQEIEVYCRAYCERTIAVRRAKNISKIFKSEVRLTEGSEPLKTSASYFYEISEPRKNLDYGKLVQQHCGV